MEGSNLLDRRSGIDHDLQLSDSQLQTLRIIAISAACLSLATGLVVGYWFVRMKRSFRHHLIMLLVFSDFWKATWQLTYPAVVFSGRAVESKDVFCQVSGFSMSLGIEASDFASVVIAIHSALYIFRPSTGSGDGGLYRYRHYVYTLWVVFSFLLASLAFINKPYAYTVQETFCYLPARPHWPRQALAWIPRYVFMLTIFGLYASVYIYVRLTFRTFRTNVGASTLEMDTVEQEEVPQLPMSAPIPRQLTAEDFVQDAATKTKRHRSQRSDTSYRSNQPFAKALTRPTEKGYLAPSPEQDEAGPSRSFDGAFDFIFPRQRHGSCSTSSTESNSGNTRSPRESVAEREMRRQRLAINKQLRLLFIYPVVYVSMWLLPLVHQALQTGGYFRRHHAFPLKCFVAFTVPAQCAIDCWLFTVREQPWKSITGNRSKSFWSSFYFWQAWNAEEQRTEELHWHANKFLSPETRHAYERREAEQKEAAEKWLVKSKDPRSPPQSAGLEPESGPATGSARNSRQNIRTEFSWWDRLEAEALEEPEVLSPIGDHYSNAENGYGLVSPVTPPMSPTNTRTIGRPSSPGSP